MVVKRRLAALLSADVAGYSGLVRDNEEAAITVLHGHRAIFDPLIAQYGGRIVNTAGDSVLAEFDSPVEAVRCALEIQEALGTRNAGLAAHDRMWFRIGINLGDVMVQDNGDLLGDGVNIAARLPAVAARWRRWPVAAAASILAIMLGGVAWYLIAAPLGSQRFAGQWPGEYSCDAGATPAF